MTLTVAARWRVTFRVQSLARVTYPAAPITTARTKARTPDLLAIAEAHKLHEEMETMRQEWRNEANMLFRRMC